MINNKLELEIDIEKDKIHNYKELQKIIIVVMIFDIFYIFINIALPIFLLASAIVSFMNLYYFFLTIFMGGVNALNYFFGKSISQSEIDIENGIDLYKDLNSEIKRSNSIIIDKSNELATSKIEDSQEENKSQDTDQIIETIKSCINLIKELNEEDRKPFEDEIDELKKIYNERNTKLIRDEYGSEIVLSLDSKYLLRKYMTERLQKLSSQLIRKAKQTHELNNFIKQMNDLDAYQELALNRSEQSLLLKRSNGQNGQ